MAKPSSHVLELPSDLADRVRDHVAKGNYGSEADVIRASLDALAAQDADLEFWLATEGVARYDALDADPARAFPARDAFVRLRDRGA